MGDERTSEPVAALKALCVLFYSLGKSSYGMLGKIIGRDRSLIYRWIREAGLSTEEPVVDGEIREMELMRCGILWVQKKKQALGPQSH
jgi:hypothetical protein